MYLDHRVTVKIARILDMVDLSAMLLDYKTKKDVAVTDAPKISLDDRFDALEHALDL